MNNIKALGKRITEVVTLWRVLTASCIVFAAGISGTWFNDQFTNDLQMQRWGWFGATIAGIAIFGGVMLAIDSLEPLRIERMESETEEEYEKKFSRAAIIKAIGFWAGTAAVIIGVLADCVMSANYFKSGHDIITASVLGFYPSLLSVIGGVIEGVRGISSRNQKRVEDKETQKLKFSHEIELAKINARLELEKERARLKSVNVHERQPAQLTIVHEQKNDAVNIRELNHEETTIIQAVRERFPLAFTSMQAEDVSPIGRTKTYAALKAAHEVGLIERESKGKWRFVA